MTIDILMKLSTRRWMLISAQKLSHKAKMTIIELYNGGAPMSTTIARKVISEFKQTPIVKDESTVDANMALLSQREYETLELLAKGFLYKEIAHQLEISVETVRETYSQHL